jgi:hypothetical protein
MRIGPSPRLQGSLPPAFSGNASLSMRRPPGNGWLRSSILSSTVLCRSHPSLCRSHPSGTLPCPGACRPPLVQVLILDVRRRPPRDQPAARLLRGELLLPGPGGRGTGPPETPTGSARAMARVPFHFAAFPEYSTTGFGLPVAPDHLGILLRELKDRYGAALPPVLHH